MNPSSVLEHSAFLSKGFRPFFLGATFYALVSMIYWGAVYFFGLHLDIGSLTPFQWHAHSMVFGYATAVIAGFLLTAVTNWTGQETLKGLPLLILFIIWLLARLCWMFLPYEPLFLGLLDLVYLLFLFFAVARAIIKVKQWRQLAIISKLLIIVTAYILFFLGALGLIPNGAYYGIYLALITEIALILTIARRVFPFFAQAGLGLINPPHSPLWIDRSSLVLLLLWLVMFIFFKDSSLTAVLSCTISVILIIRLCYWYTPTLWSASLLWSLYISLGFIALGFAMLSSAYFIDRLHYLGIHAMAYGGIGLITFSMMCRVGLGHTGRNVRAKYPLLDLALISFVLGAVFRVLFPFIFPEFARIGMMTSQLFWTISYFIYIWFYLPILTQKSL